jgi:hypothetical protein
VITSRDDRSSSAAHPRLQPGDQLTNLLDPLPDFGLTPRQLIQQRTHRRTASPRLHPR